jgi:hypothetical protein
MERAKIIGMVHQQPRPDFQFFIHGNFSCSGMSEKRYLVMSADEGEHRSFIFDSSIGVFNV